MLADTLSELHQNIKLGTTGGGFIYCGSSDAIDFYAIDKRNVVKMALYLTSCKTNIERTKRKMRRPEIEPEQRELMRHDLKLNKEKIDTVVAEILNYKKVGDREIIGNYPSVTEENTRIIIVEGNEVGASWTTEEYERRYK